MVCMPITAREMPELTILNRSGKPLTVGYTRASDQAGTKNFGIDESLPTEQPSSELRKKTQ